MSIKYYRPGDSITLYNINAQGQFNGRLSFIKDVPRPGLIYKRLALICLVFGLVGLSFVSLPIVVAQVRYQQFEHQQRTVVAAIPISPTPTIDPSASPTPEAESTSAIYSFRLTIPKINVDSPIIADVDPNSELDYRKALLTGIAQARGSFLPGQSGGPIFLFSHSTDSVLDIAQYNAQFYALKDLKPGDEVNIFYKGKKYRYIVDNQMIVAPTDLDVIRKSKANLILQTCWPPGTNWQRLLVFAHLDESVKS